MAERVRAVEALVRGTRYGLLPDPTAWAGRRVLVTGHTGFKGAWLVRWLSLLGAEVHGLALDPPTQRSLFEDAAVIDVLTTDQRFDLRDGVAVASTLAAVAPSVVLHLAAQPLVRNSVRDPASTFSINVQGTVNLLAAMRATPSPVDAAVIVTTDKVYEPGLTPHREDDPLGGNDPYAWSKAMAEQAVIAFRALPALDDARAWTTPIATARAGNVIGGGDWSAERLVPDCIRAFAADEPVRLRFPDAVRPWQHVLEPLAGYLVLAEALLSSQTPSVHARAYNFGPSDNQFVAVGEVAQGLAGRWGGSARVDAKVDSVAPSENMSLRLDSTRAHTELGWRSRWDVEVTLDRTVEAYRAIIDGESAQKVVDKQIAEYSELIHSAGTSMTTDEVVASG